MKNKLLILLISMFITPFVINAESLKTEWENSKESISIIDFKVNTNDEIIAIGVTNEIEFEGIPSNGGAEGVLLKYDNQGKELWKKIWGGKGNDFFDKVNLLSNGEIIVTGRFTSDNIDGLDYVGYFDAMLLKYDKDGNLIWKRGFGDEDYNEIYETIITEDDEIIIIWSSSEPYLKDYIEKYDKNGNLLWKKEIGYTSHPFIIYNHFKSKLTEDGGIIICGENGIKKIDKNGENVWEVMIGENDFVSGLNSFIQLDDESILAVGGYMDNETPNDTRALLIKIDENGNELWRKDYISGFLATFTSVDVLENGDILALGTYFLENGRNTGSMSVRYDSSGNLIWDKKIDIPSGEEEFINKYVTSYELNNNDLLLLSVLEASERTDLMLMKVDKDGNEQSRTIYERWNTFDFPLKYIKMKNGMLVFGYSNNTYGMFKIDKNGDPMWEFDQPSNSHVTNAFLTKDNKLLMSEYTYYKNEDNKITQIAKLSKKTFEYKIEILNEEVNGISTIEQLDSLGVITPQPNKGYKVNKIIIKDSNGQAIETTLQENGTYTFELYDDVTIEVLYMEDIENPKTGILDVMTILIIGFIISVTGIFIVKNYNERYEI